MQIVIDTRQCPCRTLNDECDISGHECYEDDICSSCPLIMNGGVKLPKGHGRLIDADSIHKIIRPIEQSDTKWGMTAETAKRLIYDAFNLVPTIIEADTESEEV